MELSKSDTEGIALYMLGILFTVLVGLSIMLIGGAWVLTAVFGTTWFEGLLYIFIGYLVFEVVLMASVFQGRI